MPTVGKKVKPKNTTKFVTGRGGSRGGEKGDYFTHTPPLSLSLSSLTYALDFLLLKLFFRLFISSKDDQTSNVSKKHRYFH